MGRQKWTSAMPSLTDGNPSQEEGEGTPCQEKNTVIMID